MKKKYMLLAIFSLLFFWLNKGEVYQTLRQWRLSICAPLTVVEPRGEPLTIDHTYIITLERQKERYQMAKESLQKPYFPKPASIFAAVDGSLIDKDTLMDNYPGIFTAKGAATLRKGEIGCALSHYQLWQKAASRPEGAATLILEDDVELYPHFQEEFKKMSAYLPREWDIIYLYNSIYTYPLLKSESPYVFRPVITRCAYAYLLSPEGAKKLLKNLFPITKPFDTSIDRLYLSQSSWLRALKVKLKLIKERERDDLLIYTLYPDLIFTGRLPTTLNIGNASSETLIDSPKPF